MSLADLEPGKPYPFDEWMQRALHDPDAGYYAKRIRFVGRRGDFATSASVSGALGEAIAGWLREETRQSPAVRTLIEIGGGDGSLMCAVRRALGFFRRRRLHCCMVEDSPVLRERQKATLGANAASWYHDVASALAACDGQAFLFHNELLDALPVTLAEWDGSRWQEIWLVRREGRWVEERRPLPPGLDDIHVFSALAARVPGQRVELGTGARAWLERLARSWRTGAMLTVDYGAEFPAVYERRPRGTLRAYVAHHRFTGDQVYEHMGRQDITADVNFTDVMRWGESLGWRAAQYGTQRDFLSGYLGGFRERAKFDLPLRFLADEHGAGSAFKVLVQRPGRGGL